MTHNALLYLDLILLCFLKILENEDLFQYLSREAGVITVPGSRFGRSGHLRFSYAVDPAVICDGIHEMGQALRKLLP